jgi:hypothetical protein
VGSARPTVAGVGAPCGTRTTGKSSRGRGSLAGTPERDKKLLLSIPTPARSSVDSRRPAARVCKIDHSANYYQRNVDGQSRRRPASPRRACHLGSLLIPASHVDECLDMHPQSIIDHHRSHVDVGVAHHQCCSDLELGGSFPKGKAV